MDLFVHRKTEIETLAATVRKLKRHIKANLSSILLKKRDEDLFKAELQKKARKTGYSRKGSTMSESTVMDILEERSDLNFGIDKSNLNINNYLHVLSPQERAAYERIIRKVPHEKQVYVQ